MGDLRTRIKAALGERESDLLIKNARLVNVFSGQIERTDVAVWDGWIVGFGEYKAKEVLDLNGDFLCPGLIDSHVHIESSLVTPPEYAAAVLPHGTTSVITDPHEIANVLGARGIRFMAESSKGTPLDVYFMIPSCVPATSMETAGASLTAKEIGALLQEPWALGLAEMMNVPGVLYGDPEVLKKIELAKGRRIDGHAPLLSGKGLSAYLTARIRSDHESTQLREAKEKLKSGMWVMVREGTTARNLKDLVPLITPLNSRRFLLVTDDRHPKELIEEGHIDFLIRKTIQQGIDPVSAIQMATLNPAEYFRLEGIGAIAPGYRADLVVFDHLARFQVKKVFKDGRLVAEDGKLLRPRKGHGLQVKKSPPKDISPYGSVRIKPLSIEDLRLRSKTPLAKVIQWVPNQLLTKKIIRNVPLIEGIASPDIENDLLKIVVLERHHRSGKIGIGFVQGFGMKKGALGSSVAHDSHNLILVGTNDSDILETIKRIETMGGGMAVLSGGKTLASLPLPIAGLMAEVSVREVNRRLQKLNAAAQRLGCRIPDPFMALSFLALPVIPELKLTDQGLVDVNRFRIVPVFGEE